MTQIRAMFGPTKRAGELGVHSVDSFHLTVPSLVQAEQFYGAFGLDLCENAFGLEVRAGDDPHRWGTIKEGAAKQLSHISFGAFAEDFVRFQTRLQDLGIKQLDSPTGFESNGIWFRDSEGFLIEIRVSEKTSPNEKSPVDNSSVPAGYQGAPNRRSPTKVRPRRLSHILIFTADVRRSVDFYSRVLGLRLSDRAGDDIAFMHGIHGSDHHLLAFAQGNGPGLHHLSWDVGSIHEIGSGAMQMADKGYDKGWGLGRHVLGSNYFHYVRDPWGSYSEYSSDIDYIPANYNWDAGDHPPEDSFYIWGPKPPEDFAFNYEMAGKL